MARIGTQAPEWCTTAYHGGGEVELSSAEYRGKWYVLYRYPLDFTFVCPTEIRGFQAMLGDFREEGVEVIGASTDSFFSHKAWFADGKIFADEITHPVIADTNHAVSRSFDVLKEDQGVAYRANGDRRRPRPHPILERQRLECRSESRRGASNRPGAAEWWSLRGRLEEG